MKGLLSIFLFVVVIVLAFQNCSEPKIVIAPQISKLEINFPTGEICPGYAEVEGQKEKIVFIIDMSLSNIGISPNGSNKWNLDKSKATDWDGVRFTEINKFLNGCGNSPNLEYQVIGFGTEYIFGTHGGQQRTCTAPFVSDFETAKSFINSLKRVQEEDIGNENAGTYSSPYTMGTTSYFSALDCLNRMISVDIANNQAETNVYKVFFVTDGEPNEGSDLDSDDICQEDTDCENFFASCNDGEQCLQNRLNNKYYREILEEINDDAKLQSAHVEFYPIYYGEDEKFDEARVILDDLATVTNEEQETIKINDIENFTESLCEIFETKNRIPYEISNLHVVNLTAIEKNGEWKPDSDMDGIIDEEEIVYDFINFNARTHKALDILCLDPEDPKCTELPEDCGQLKGYLSVCDKQVVDKNNLTRVDTDKDGYLDFIEIIRGGNPLSEENNFSDYDGDGKSNNFEIRMGTNVREKTPFEQIKNLVDISLSDEFAKDVCPNDLNSKTFVVNNLPFAENVLAYRLDTTTGSLNINHDEGENVFLMYYTVSPTAEASSIKTKVFGAVFKIRYSSNARYIKKDDFVLIGEY